MGPCCCCCCVSRHTAAHTLMLSRCAWPFPSSSRAIEAAWQAKAYTLSPRLHETEFRIPWQDSLSMPNDRPPRFNPSKSRHLYGLSNSSLGFKSEGIPSRTTDHGVTLSPDNTKFRPALRFARERRRDARCSPAGTSPDSASEPPSLRHCWHPRATAAWAGCSG
jgi:hypothetical protein